MTEDTDLRNIKPRLQMLAVSAVISAVLTFFTVNAMVSSGRGVGADPINTSSSIVLGIAIFVICTLTSYTAITNAKRKASKLTRR